MVKTFVSESLHLNCFSDKIEDEIEFDVSYHTGTRRSFIVFTHLDKNKDVKFKITYDADCTFTGLTKQEKEENIDSPDGKITLWDWIVSSYRMKFRKAELFDEEYLEAMGLDIDDIGPSKTYILMYHKPVGTNASFWCETGGYTTNIDKAELFSEKDAEEYHKSRPTDIPFPFTYAESVSRNRIDCQCISKSSSNKFPLENLVITYNKSFDGNDVNFIVHDKYDQNFERVNQYTTYDLDSATIFTKDDALKVIRGSHAAFPIEYLKQFSRRTVDASSMTIKHAKEQCPFKIIKSKSYTQKYNCAGCGSFISERSYYTGGLCKKCKY